MGYDLVQLRRRIQARGKKRKSQDGNSSEAGRNVSFLHRSQSSYSNSSSAQLEGYNSGSLRRSTSLHLHTAIVEGAVDEAQRCVRRIVCEEIDTGQSNSSPIDFTLSYIGVTNFGTTIAYQQTPLGVAIRHRRWRVFRGLLEAGVNPNCMQRMLQSGDSRNGKNFVQNFTSALDLFLFAAARPTYFPPSMPDQELIEILHILISRGADMSLAPQTTVRRLCSAACMDLRRLHWDAETSTGVVREAASLLRCLLQNGLNTPAHLFLDYPCGKEDDNLYTVVLCSLVRFHANVINEKGSSMSRSISTQSGLTISKDQSRYIFPPQLRAFLVLLLNLIYTGGCLLPNVLNLNPKLMPPQTVFAYHTTFLSLVQCKPPKLQILARHVVRQNIPSFQFKKHVMTGFKNVNNISETLRRYIIYLDECDLQDELRGIFIASQFIASQISNV